MQASFPVEFVAPAESIEKGFGRLVGAGRVIPGDTLVVEGTVYEQTWPFLIPLTIVFMLGGIGVGIGLDLFELGVWGISIGGPLAVVAYEVYQRKTGREIRLRIPKTAGYRIERMDAVAVVQIQLDTFVVNGGTRPPIVVFRVEGLEAIDAVRASLAR